MSGSWNQPVFCDSCGALFAEAEISPDELGLLADIELLRQFRSEVDLRQRHDDLCQRYPPLWKLLQPDFSGFCALPPPYL